MSASLASCARRAHCIWSSFSSRLMSTAVVPKGFCFDIDGVLLRGYNQLPNARRTLLKLAAENVPFLLVTNGGGEVEWKKALQLSKVLGVRIHPEQLIISSTPLKAVCTGLADTKVLVLGCRDVMGVAHSYGLKKAVSAPMLAADDPTRYPFHATPHKCLSSYGIPKEEPIGAVMVLHDPTDYADLQLALDALRGGWPHGSGGHTQSIPYYISNNDLLFAGVYPVPRLAGGSFTVALSALWKAVTGTELDVTIYGKPSLYTSTYAAQQLGRWALMSQELGYGQWAEVRQGSDNDLKPEVWESRATEFAGRYPAPRPHQHHGQSEAKTAGSASSHGKAQHGTSQHSQSLLPRFSSIYMVGDNPRADVALARNAGKPWTSLLVRTGVFQGPGPNDTHNPADHVVQGVGEAVDLALKL